MLSHCIVLPLAAATTEAAGAPAPPSCVEQLHRVAGAGRPPTITGWAAARQRARRHSAHTCAAQCRARVTEARTARWGLLSERRSREALINIASANLLASLSLPKLRQLSARDSRQK